MTKADTLVVNDDGTPMGTIDEETGLIIGFAPGSKSYWDRLDREMAEEEKFGAGVPQLSVIGPHASNLTTPPRQEYKGIWEDKGDIIKGVPTWLGQIGDMYFTEEGQPYREVRGKTHSYFPVEIKTSKVPVYLEEWNRDLIRLDEIRHLYDIFFNKWAKEVMCLIFKRHKGTEHLYAIPVQVGSAGSVDWEDDGKFIGDCMGKGDLVGSIHVHPGNSNVASGTDLSTWRRDSGLHLILARNATYRLYGSVHQRIGLLDEGPLPERGRKVALWRPKGLEMKDILKDYVSKSYEIQPYKGKTDYSASASAERKVISRGWQAPMQTAMSYKDKKKRDRLMNKRKKLNTMQGQFFGDRKDEALWSWLNNEPQAINLGKGIVDYAIVEAGENTWLVDGDLADRLVKAGHEVIPDFHRPCFTDLICG